MATKEVTTALNDAIEEIAATGSRRLIAIMKEEMTRQGHTLGDDMFQAMELLFHIYIQDGISRGRDIMRTTLLEGKAPQRESERVN